MNELNEITSVSADKGKNFVLMKSDITHDCCAMRLPEYDPFAELNGEEWYKNYYEENADLYTVDGRTLRIETNLQLAHYHSNFKAMQLVGKWLEYLKENDVYDNTRIIIVADHGYPLTHFDEFIFGEVDIMDGKFNDIMAFNPLLMVKDFNSKESTTDMSFMTNADVPSIAMEHIVDKPVNPFTGKEISTAPKNTPEHKVFFSDCWQIDINNSNTFIPGTWYSTTHDMLNASSWKQLN